MITSDGWIDWATPMPVGLNPDTGRTYKTNPGKNGRKLFVAHSVVGYKTGCIDIMLNPKSGRLTHFLNCYDGELIQFASLDDCCWSSGSAYPNDNGIAAEMEGGYNPHEEPLTTAQFDTLVRLLKELEFSSYTRPLTSADKSATLYEHHECIRWGTPYTECPSGRIPWEALIGELEAPPMPAPEPVPWERVYESFKWYQTQKQAGKLAELSDYDWGTFEAIHNEIKAAKRLFRYVAALSSSSSSSVGV